MTDLSAYAGRKVLLRFEYITDDATNLTGFAVDNIQVPQIGPVDPYDSANGWTADGFERITGPMPQQFIVQAISGNGTVQRDTWDFNYHGFTAQERIVRITDPAEAVAKAIELAQRRRPAVTG